MGRAKLKPGTHGRISAWKTGKGRQWQARATARDLLGEYHQPSAVGMTRDAAEDRLQEKLDDLLGTTVVAAITTVSDLCWDWYNRIEAESTAFWSRPDATERQGETPPRPQSLVHTKRAINYVCAEDGGIGNLSLNEVTTLTLEQWLDGHKRISRGRAEEIRVALRGAFRSAVRLGILLTDPMAGVSPVRRHDPRPVALEAEELQTIRRILREERTLNITRTTADNLDVLLVLLLGAALRPGEGAALRWGDLTLDGNRPSVTVSGTQVELKGKSTFRQETPKTDSSNRTILLPPAVVEALRSIRPERAKPSDWVFPTRHGNCWNTGNAGKILDRIVSKSNGALKPERVSFHKLRSTAATAIAEAHNDHIAGQVLGHKPKGITQQHYIARRNIAPDVRAALQALVESSDPAPQQEAQVLPMTPTEPRRTARRHLQVVS
ncbi:tyrosine-type recombinase/integrase [Myceligenerans indicum]|uniref:Tyrosine-type recombinase/integrase n=1 Tax=Myceligenerans indicum TaxID=2593663 RepID=A0ABS1LS01_9MICO|nr:tyrosine-type recombinase/integrase [Myceligenerans indicum]MBL0888789.1 tyrosine-type recombinase/integrase [Myceligenerans indicum]